MRPSPGQKKNNLIITIEHKWERQEPQLESNIPSNPIYLAQKNSAT